MQIRKIVLDQLERAYSTGYVRVDGKPMAIIASEAVDGPCYSYHGEQFEHKTVVWEHGGGTMSIVEIPNSNGEFLATQRFFPGFNAATSKIVHGKYQNGAWVIEDFMTLPYVHRFDILQAADGLYFVGATLCTSKTEREDWSDPGKIYVGKLTGVYNEPIALTVIKEGLTRNHGYCRGMWNGLESGFVTTDEGVFVVTPPNAGSDWTVEQLMSHRVSDVALCDINQDGTDELVTIEPFHGAEFYIYQKTAAGYEKIYSYPDPIEFAHVVWGGKLRGKETIIGGVRRQRAELFYIQKEGNELITTIIDEGKGPANVAVIHEEHRDIIITANNTVHEAALYIVED